MDHVPQDEKKGEANGAHFEITLPSSGEVSDSYVKEVLDQCDPGYFTRTTVPELQQLFEAENLVERLVKPFGDKHGKLVDNSRYRLLIYSNQNSTVISETMLLEG